MNCPVRPQYWLRVNSCGLNVSYAACIRLEQWLLSGYGETRWTAHFRIVLKLCRGYVLLFNHRLFVNSKGRDEVVPNVLFS